ncbi:hypothetical protein FOA52_010931 [Chlamydomonas sp. UWO 241]|nr:hypothetical protein FOA52_010931 [Chlamydomonas sp. UWO 241]
MAAFIKRVFDHLFNQVLVESLSNSRWFQKFAVWSHSTAKELQAKSKDGGSVFGDQMGAFVKNASEAGAKFRNDFAAEMKKVQEEMEKQAVKGGGSSTDPTKNLKK